MPHAESDTVINIIDKYYPHGHPARDIILTHCHLVRAKCLKIAHHHPELGANEKFLAEASMLHDIGIFMTEAPAIGCHGPYPYICHGYLGRGILEKENLPKHGLVCERHTGTGISKEEIKLQKLPIPHRDMIPQTIEEKIICFADTFFSKGKDLEKEKTPEEIKTKLQYYGTEKVEIFSLWCKMFL